MSHTLRATVRSRCGRIYHVCFFSSPVIIVGEAAVSRRSCCLVGGSSRLSTTAVSDVSNKSVEFHICPGLVEKKFDEAEIHGWLPGHASKVFTRTPGPISALGVRKITKYAGLLHGGAVLTTCPQDLPQHGGASTKRVRAKTGPEHAFRGRLGVPVDESTSQLSGDGRKIPIFYPPSPLKIPPTRTFP